MLSFRQYVGTRKTPLREGISHIEDLPVDEFIHAIENLNKMIASQKLDGANLWLGMDEEGDLFTSREAKVKHKVFYEASDYDESSGHDGFRAAHLALMKNSAKLKAVLEPGNVVEMEIMFGRQPNAIIYGSGGMNYIAFLRMVEGDDSMLDKLENAMHNHITKIESIVHDSPDGSSIIKEKVQLKWKFVRPEVIDAKELQSVDLKKELASLKKFLNSYNEEADKVTGGKLKTNYEVLTGRGKELKELKDIVKEKMMNDYLLNIKETLLDRFVRNVKPKLQADDASDDAFGIEGVVFLDPETKKQFKLVDKDIFSAINKFNYEARSKIATTIKTDDPGATLDMRGGIFGDAKARIGQVFGIKGLSTTLGMKRALRKFKGETAIDTVKAMMKSMHELEFGSSKKKIEAILHNALKDVDEALDDFKENADKYKLKLKTGKTVKYTPEVRRRTLLLFAETKKDIETILAKVSRAKTIGDLIVALFARQIKEIHAEPEEEKPIEDK